MNIVFYLVQAGGRSHMLSPNRAPYVIGREPGVSIVLQDALISRKHLELHWNGASWKAVDLGARNGTNINGNRLQGSKELADGDQIQCGGQVLNYIMLPPNSDLGTIKDQAPQIANQITLAPGMNLADLAGQDAAFSGAISDGGLLELLQFFSMTRKSGRLDLTGIPGASIWLEAGTSRHARTLSHGEGFNALLALADKPGDRFAFFADESAPAITIQGSADGILMELARLIDEAGR